MKKKPFDSKVTIKDLDQVITFIENDLLPENCEKEMVLEAIIIYADLHHRYKVQEWKKNQKQ